MSTLTRFSLALCAAGLAGSMVPGMALAQSLITRDPQVCCVRTDAAGKQYPFHAPRSQCRPPLQIVAPARCAPTLERRICCRTPNGYVLMPESRCTGPGIARAHPDRCQQTTPAPTGRVCCWTHHGVIARPAAQCPQPGPNASPMNSHPVPMDQCTKPVCCRVGAKTPAVYEIRRAMDCAFKGSQFKVSAIHCKARPQSICCRMAYPGAPIKYVLTEPRKCAAPHGHVVDNKYCVQRRPSLLRKPG